MVKEIVKTSYNVLVDWVSVEVDIKHSAGSDLEIRLVSPAGTQSVFVTSRLEVLDVLLVCVVVCACGCVCGCGVGVVVGSNLFWCV